MPYDYRSSFNLRLNCIDRILNNRDVFLSVGGTDHNDIITSVIESFLKLKHKYNLGTLDIYCSKTTEAKICRQSFFVF